MTNVSPTSGTSTSTLIIVPGLVDSAAWQEINTFFQGPEAPFPGEMEIKELTETTAGHVLQENFRAGRAVVWGALR